MYCLSSAVALEKFLKNPRPYLLPPQPRPPCKISVLGPPLSGKTTLSHLVAQKYGAKVRTEKSVNVIHYFRIAMYIYILQHQDVLSAIWFSLSDTHSKLQSNCGLLISRHSKVSSNFFSAVKWLDRMNLNCPTVIRVRIKILI